MSQENDHGKIVHRDESGVITMNETLKAGNQTAKLSTVSIDKDLTAMNRNSVVLGLKQEIKTRVSDILNI